VAPQCLRRLSGFYATGHFTVLDPAPTWVSKHLKPSPATAEGFFFCLIFPLFAPDARGVFSFLNESLPNIYSNLFLEGADRV
jgi:hypothetical protein